MDEAIKGSPEVGAKTDPRYEIANAARRFEALRMAQQTHGECRNPRAVLESASHYYRFLSGEMP